MKKKKLLLILAVVLLTLHLTSTKTTKVTNELHDNQTIKYDYVNIEPTYEMVQEGEEVVICMSIQDDVTTKVKDQPKKKKKKINKKEQRRKEAQQKIKKLDDISDKKEWFIAYKNIIKEYEDVLDAPESVYDCFSDKEILLFQKLIAAEATSGSFNSKCNVASVVWNRLYSDDYPNTIIEVIYERNGAPQFSPTIDGRINIVNVTEDDILAIEYTFMFGSTAYDCIAFDNVKGSSWNKRNLEHVFTDDINHSFYR